MSGFDRRTYQREYARRRRLARQAAANASRTRCAVGHGAGVCGGFLETVVDRMTGRAAVVCPLCERRRRGICRDCPRPVAGAVGKALRCAACKERALAESVRRYAAHHRDALRRRARHSYRKDKAVRERRNAYKRLWRQANPEKVKRQKRREALRQNPRLYEYHRQYREARRAGRDRRELARYHGVVEPRTCLTPGCEAVVSGRAKKCAPCKQAARELATLALRAARERAA